MPAQVAPFVCDTSRLPYPVAITAQRLIDSLESSSDVVRRLTYLKECFEATIKFLGGVLLADYFRSPAADSQRNTLLLEKLGRPSLGAWRAVVDDVSRWLLEANIEGTVGRAVATIFVQPPAKMGGKPKPAQFMKDCEEFVTYRNESSFGHGALRCDAACEKELQDWLPMLRELLNGVERMADWRLCLVTSSDCCSVWMGTERGAVTETDTFAEDLCGHFVLRRSAEVEATCTRQEVTDLFPFLCYLPDREQRHRLHFYESIRNYREVRKEVDVLEYDNGFRCVSTVPIAGLERLFTAELLAKAAKRQQGRMELIEGRVAGFGELIVEHANIVGRKFVINAVKQFIEEHDRGLLVIEAEPGKGKTALMCHLIEDVFGHYSPQPIRFFYRRTGGITDPDVCVRTIYDDLLKSHELSASDEDKKKSSPEEMMKKLTDLLNGTIAPKLSPSRPQLILIDALDEAEKTSSGKDAFQRIPESLPAGVYVIATTRHIQRRTRLARRSHVHWYDLDSPDFLQDNLRDGTEFVRRELKDCRVPSETVKEIARIGAGNFLALKLLVKHVRGSDDPRSVDYLLRRIATEPANEHLRVIYEEFWERLTGRMEPHEIQILCDVAGLLVTARWPLSAEMICECLRFSSAVWDFALRQLVEYLTVIEGIELEEQGEREAYYRVYHESFAEFLRAKNSQDLRRLESILADYCRHWDEHAHGRGRLYSLRFAPEHLLHTAEHDPRRWNQLEELLTDIFFLEAKAQAGFVFELAADLSAAWRTMSSDRPMRVIVRLLDEAVRREIHFIARHAETYPQALFQCVWNVAWWYGNPDAASYYLNEGEEAASDGTFPKVADSKPPGCLEIGESLIRLLERWRCMRESKEPLFVWIRSLRPPAVHLGTNQIAVLRLSTDSVRWVGGSLNDSHIIVGCDSSVRRFDASTGRELCTIAEWDESKYLMTAFAISSERNLAIGAFVDAESFFDRFGTQCAEETGLHPWITIWDMTSGTERTFSDCRSAEIAGIAFSQDGSKFISFARDHICRIWSTANFTEIGVINLRQQHSLTEIPDFNKSAFTDFDCACLSADGTRIASCSSSNMIQIWDAETGTRLISFCCDQSAMLRGICYSPNGKQIAAITAYNHVEFNDEHAASGDGFAHPFVIVFDAQTGHVIETLHGHIGALWCLCYSPDSTQVVTGSSDRSLILWNPIADWHDEFWGHEDEVCTVYFSQDGTRIMSGSSDGTVRTWNAQHRKESSVLHGHIHRIEHIQFFDEGRRIVSHAQESEFTWDGHNGVPVLGFTIRRGRFNSLEISVDGKRCAQQTVDGLPTLEIWDTTSNRGIITLHWENPYPTECSLSPDGTRVAWSNTRAYLLSSEMDDAPSIDGQYVIHVLGVDDGTRIASLTGHQAGVIDLCFSDDGETVVAASADNTIRVWNASTGEPVTVIYLESPVLRLWLSADGSQIVVLDESHSLRAFNSTDGSAQFELERRDHGIGDVCLSPDLCFSPDGNKIVGSQKSVGDGADDPCEIVVWSAKNGGLLEVIHGRGDIKAIAADVERRSLRLLVRDGETIVENPAGQIVARYPNVLNHIATHPNGRTWAGAISDYLALIHLEGVDNS